MARLGDCAVDEALVLITIIVPVYNAPEATARCIKALLSDTPAEVAIHIVDDASTDSAIAPLLASVQAQADPRVQLFSNSENLGFTRSVNSAMARVLAMGGDALLLNSDTEVTPGWLDAILRVAASDARIATVTPFSNNAEICSFPQFLVDNPWLARAESIKLAKVCALADDGTTVDLPTGVGFCMYIRGAAWAEIGPFDAETFGRGYGEENDWCQRAIGAGWRNAFAPGAYVQHQGGQSFSDEKRALMQENGRRLVAKFPEYDRDVQRFIAADPIARYRAAIHACQLEGFWARMRRRFLR